jgi:serine/threonine-protein kinase
MARQEQFHSMIGQIISHYRVLGMLGTGGMGVVYRAHDERLNRDVALKVLPTETTSSEVDRKRLHKEALALSKLSHPHIAQIYDFDIQNGIAFLVMEYIRGNTLAKTLTDGPFSEEDAISVGLQIASALKDAAEVGIVHRDLKPSNVMFSLKRDVKILDFGLAKLLRTNDMEITQSCDDLPNAAGTLPYMSPEQLRREPADFRSDIYSLGAVLYETATGKRPFGSTNSATLIADILGKTPESPSKLNANLSGGFENIILRCLAKEPARRYQTASELSIALESIHVSTSSNQATQSLRRRRLRVVLPLVVLMIIVLAGLITIWQRHKSQLTVDAFRPNELAILPMNLAQSDSDTAAFNNGLIETLTSRLTQLSSSHPLQVVPASEVRALGVTNLEEARQQFGATLGLELSVERSGELVRVNYALVDANRHRQLRGGTITASAADPFSLEDKVADSVVNALQIELSPNERITLDEHGTSKPRAFDYYLQGRGYIQDFHKSENIENAIAEFNHALEQDPNYALAYAGLGEAFWRKYQYSKNREWVNRAKSACERAVSLKTDQAEGHNCLGLVYSGTGAYEKAVEQYQLSLTIQPTDDNAYNGLALAYSRLNKPEEAEKTFKAAISLRPNYWAGYNWLGELYLQHGKFEDAEAMFSEVTALAPDSFVGYTNLGSAYLNQGRYEEAIPLLKRSVNIRRTAETSSNLGTAYFGLRQFENAARTYEQATKLDDLNYEVWGNLADAYYWAPGMRQLAPAAYQTAISLAQKKLQVNPRDANLLGYLAGYYAMVGDRKNSLESLDRALAIAPSNPNLLLEAAQIHNQLGEKDSAIDFLQKAIAAGISPSALRDSPNFDNLHDDLRFKQLAHSQ